MKKLLIILVIALLFGLMALTVMKGINISSLSIASAEEIKNTNDNLEQKLQEATKIASTDYQSRIKILNDNADELEKQKNIYQELVDVSTESQLSVANETKTYPIEFLTIRIGNYADDEKVNLEIGIEKESTSAQNVYNINFTARGKYIDIASFIEDIEDDSSLGFKIDEFSMYPVKDQNGSIVEATFTCKDITITGITTTTSNADIKTDNSDEDVKKDDNKNETKK